MSLLFNKLASEQRITIFIIIIDINSVRSKGAAILEDFVATSQFVENPSWT